MEIRDSRSPANLVPFANLKLGETFVSGTNLFLRTISKAESPVNAVALADGRMYLFSLTDDVLPIAAYVVREG